MSSIAAEIVELASVRYAIVREADLRAVCDRVDVAIESRRAAAPTDTDVLDPNLDRVRLARRLAGIRLRTGLTQTELARRAGVRVETVNRIERGKTTPDFATIRKLVVAINAAESPMKSP